MVSYRQRHTTRIHILVLTTGISFLVFLSYVFIRNDKKITTMFPELRKYSNSNEDIIGLCSDKAQQYGPRQKVVSFSLYIKEGQGETEYVLNRYMPGLRENLKRIRNVYPGWIMRVYTNITRLDMVGDLQNLQNEKDFFVCNISSVQFKERDLEKMNGMIWRFLPLLDPTVDIFLVRDLDSAVNEREQSAVKQWEQSDKVFHTMRDHPRHTAFVMGGLWGGKNYMMNHHMKFTIKHKIFIKENHDLNDQDILKNALYVSFKNIFMVHDSYFCEHIQDSIPFPVERTDIKHFVGGTYLNLSDQTNVAICPVTCRPHYGKQWTYC